MAESVMQREPQILCKWGSYDAGVVLKGIEQTWRKTKDQKFFSYIKTNVDQFINPDGTINTYDLAEYNIDHVNNGKLLLFLYRETGEEKYKKAACLQREQFKTHPRTEEGGLWHKQIYANQMWLDGIFMGSPFYAEFAQLFDEPQIFDDVALQILLIEKHTKDAKTGLFYHGWDESRQQSWASPQTGCSANFWGRAMGWYAMALVDVLDVFPENHAERAKIIGIFQAMIASLIKVQDKATGLWYQVLDQGEREGNYLEASASSMFVYAIAKAVRKGYLAKKYQEVAQKGFDGIINNLIEVDNDLVNLNQNCKVAGLGRFEPEQPYRDGSFEYYISEPIVPNDHKGIGAFLLACVEMGS
jgi:unsaturated rhamnogalacturonyl hydrolase